MDYIKKEYTKTLSVIILNYKNVDLTVKCIDSVIKSAKNAEISIEIIVVDNSALETADKLKKILPKTIKIIENKVNQGFSRAINQGIQLCDGKCVLLLNNDAFVNKECLMAGITYLKENRDCGVWAPKIVGEDGSFQVSCARLPSIKGLIGEYIIFKNFDWYNNIDDWNEPQNVGSVVGAYLLLRKSVIDQVGLLDEDFFFNVEDVDYCKRVHEAGLSVIYDPRYSVVHIGGASSNDSWMNSKHLHNYRIVYFRKHHGKIYGWLAKMIINLGLTIRSIK
jgi:GT2 family glycosyltransferase